MSNKIQTESRPARKFRPVRFRGIDVINPREDTSRWTYAHPNAARVWHSFS